MNNRRSERYSLELNAKIVVSGVQEDNIQPHMTSKTVDINSGGAFFKTGSPLPVGSEVDIELHLPLDQLKTMKGDKVRIKVSGEVVRAIQQGMAVSFSEDFNISKVADEPPSAQDAQIH